MRKIASDYIPEPGVYILIGFILSLIIHVSESKLKTSEVINQYLVFESDIFFLVLLPIIIFEAGYFINLSISSPRYYLSIYNRYNMKQDSFFYNIGSIISMAFGVTVVTAFFIGAVLYILSVWNWIPEFSFINALTFGSIISATDPVSVLSLFSKLGVDNSLYSIVFGESVLNDAVAMVLYKTLLVFQTSEFTLTTVIKGIFSFISVFLGSFSSGVLVGCLSALLFKYLDLVGSEMRDLERGLLFVIPFISYMFANGLDMSGIVSMLFCGMTMSHYTFHNISPKRYPLLLLFVVYFFFFFFFFFIIFVLYCYIFL